MAQIKINNLSFQYDTHGEDIFKNVCINIDTDWKLGLIGRNGRGKTTFLKLLQGVSLFYFQSFGLLDHHLIKVLH